MTKDCLEDHMMLLAWLKKNRKPPQKPHDIDANASGFPTVDQIMQTSDVFYGPLKIKVLWHGSV